MSRLFKFFIWVIWFQAGIVSAQKASFYELTPAGMRQKSYKAEPFLLGEVVHSVKKYKSYDISFKADQGVKQYALISFPEVKMPSDGYPVIFLLHGYIPPARYSTSNSYRGIFRRYAESEFVVIKPDFRGHGRSESGTFDPELSKLYYVQDLRYLIAAMSSDNRFNTKRFFIMGHSNGGDIALRFLTGAPGLIQAASLWAPVTVKLEESNFFWRGGGKRSFGDEALSLGAAGKSREEYRLQAKRALSKLGFSSLEEIRYYPYLKDITSALIIRHPDSDESVPYEWSLKFLKLYEASGNPLPLKLINYPGDNHNLAQNQAKAQMDDLKWFRTFK